MIVALCVTVARASDPIGAASEYSKYSVTDPSILQRLIVNGARVIQDYDAFTVVSAPSHTDTSLHGVAPLPLENYVLLNAGPIDTTKTGAAALRSLRGAFSCKTMHLIQFAGPIRPEWVDAILRTNVEIITYIPSNAYLVYGDSNSLAALQAFSNRATYVQWDGAYLDSFRINPQAAALVQNAAPGQSHLLSIQLIIDPSANRETLAMIDRLKTAPTSQQYEILHYLNIVVDFPLARIADLATRSDVVSIDRFDMPRHHDERQDQIVAGNILGNSPTLGTGYLAWLSARGFTQAQFTASNFAVDLSDSGIDNGTTTPNHFGLYVNGIRPGTSRVVYNRLVGIPNSGSTLKGCDGHGTLNAHVVGGYVSSTNTTHADAVGYRYGLGVAPFVKVGSSVIFDPYNFTFPIYSTLQSQAYGSNARISSNSWGIDAGNIYNTTAQTYDVLVRDAQSATSGNQQMTILFSAGNDGPGGSTVTPPGTAKNVICVGASEGVLSFGSADGCGAADSSANSANDMAAFSSRGPCADGRKKPDLVAPGSHITGGVVQSSSPSSIGTSDACYTALGVCGGPGGSSFFPTSSQEFYTASTGTSHSTPCVAGGCALVRQFFINQGLSPPSPSMVKGFLMNSARYLTGANANDTFWSNSQGMGCMNLGEAFNRLAVTPTVLRDEVPGDMFTASGQTRSFSGSIADSSKPFRVTLAWTDAPGPTSGSAFQNNLNLTVTVGGNTYLGNAFSGASSITGGIADAANNVESVFRPSGLSGAFTVTVTAANITANGVPNVGGSLDQDFSLIIYNGTTGCGTLTLSPALLPNANVGVSYAQNIVTSGGTAPYSYALLSGAFPNGMGLSGSGVLSGTAIAGGSFNFTVRSTDAAGCTGTRAYTLAVCAAMSVTPGTLPNGKVGMGYAESLSATGGVAPYSYIVSAGTLPSGLSFSTVGNLTGTPSSASITTVIIRATDAIGCSINKPYTIVICGNLLISPVSLGAGAVGTPFSQSLISAGGTAPYNWSLASGELPAGLTLGYTTGELAGTPTVGGTFDFTVQALDAVNCIGSRAYSLTISGGSCGLSGDLNGDALVDGLDIQPFVECLISGSSTQGACNCGDINENSSIDEFDVLPFVAALLGS